MLGVHEDLLPRALRDVARDDAARLFPPVPVGVLLRLEGEVVPLGAFILRHRRETAPGRTQRAGRDLLRAAE